jgi:hypothetical protein
MVIAEPTTSRGDRTVSHIKQLQETEQQAFKELENQSGAVTLTTEQKSALVSQINDLSATRETLYASLRENHSFYSKNLTSAQHTLVQQTDALEVVEKELNRSKKRVELINDERINRLRLVEINRYYGDKYKHHTSILKNVTLMFAILLVVIMTNNTGMLPPMVFKSLLIIVLIIGLYAIIKELFDAYTRDNMVYAQYNWSKVSPGLEHPGNLAGSNIFDNGDDPDAGACKNQECCGTGFTWVPPPFNKCIANSELTSEDVVSAMGGPVKPYDATTAGSSLA